MVKVLPSNFTFFETQHILSPTGEPLAVACSNELLFIAVEGCMIEAYDLSTLKQLAQFRTVSPVIQLAYNSKGDCIVTLERKHSVSQGFVRVYFKWRGLSADKPMRILLASVPRGSIPSQNRIAAEIIELPSDSCNSVSCLACCEYTGRIAVGMDSLLRIFSLEEDKEGTAGASKEPSTPVSPSASLPTSTKPLPSHPTTSLPPFLLSPSSSSIPNVEILLDIQTNSSELKNVSIVGDYVAFISTNEVRVVKLSLFQPGTDVIPDYQPPVNARGEKRGVARKAVGNIVEDKNFVSWSPSIVWEAEKRAAVDSGVSQETEVGGFVESHENQEENDHKMSLDAASRNMACDVTSEGHMTSRDVTHSPPLIGSLTLDSVEQATAEKLSDRTTMEILGPVEYVWGHPLTVKVNKSSHSSSLSRPDCRVLTMLYRRFSSTGDLSSSRAQGRYRPRGATLPARGGGGGSDSKEALHSVKLVPIFVGGASPNTPQQLVGISCFIANAYHGHLYDVHQQCRLLSSFSFMARSQLVCCEGMFMHALSMDSVETYTSRSLQGTLSNLPFGDSLVTSPLEEEVEEEAEEKVEEEEEEEEEKKKEEEEEGKEEEEEKEEKEREGENKEEEEGGKGEKGRETEEEDGEEKTEDKEEKAVVGGGGGKQPGRGVGGEGEGEEGEEEEVRVKEKTMDSSVGAGEEGAGDGDSVRMQGDPQQCSEVWLRQPIPSHSLDLTLISTAKFIGSCYLATSQDYMVVVTKGKSEQTAQTTTSWLLQSLTPRKAKTEHMWNIYVLKMKNVAAMYCQFMEFASNHKENSPPMYQHILSEGHVLLRNELLHGVCSAEMLRWLRENCFQLANSLCHYSKLHGMETQAAHYFIMSGALAVDVVRSVLSISSTNKSTAFSVLMTYLNLILFDHRNAEKQMPALRPLANKVLELFASHAPHRVTPLLLHSWLAGYSVETALTVLGGQPRGEMTEEERLERSYCTELCRAMLYLRVDREREASSAVTRVPKTFLSQWMNSNLHFIADKTTKTLTHLGKLIQSVQESCLLDLCVRLLREDTMSFRDICTVLQTVDVESLADNVTLKQFLEIIILDKSKDISKATIAAAVLLLVDVLFARLLSGHTPKPSSSAPFTLYGSRHKWLDSVAPFGESASLGGSGRVRQGHLQDLMQLQALLCSSHMSEVIAKQVEELLQRTDEEQEEGEEVEDKTGKERRKKEFPYSLSLRLITWPHLGRVKEACVLALQRCPMSAVDFCLTVFPDQLDLWAWLLEQLLGYIQMEGESEQLYTLLYKEALSHVVTITTPKQFLSLLPPSGSVTFFLPFIESSCKLYFAKQTSDKLHASLLS